MKDNPKSQSTWKRGFYGLLYTIFRRVAEIALFAVVIFRYLLPLFRGETIRSLRRLGQSIRTCATRPTCFLISTAGITPFPFGAWSECRPKPAHIARQSKCRDNPVIFENDDTTE